ncbi:MAG: ABC transporter ATP-binding protein [Janthinobacterium lividum]
MSDVQIQALCKSFGPSPVLSGIDLSVRSGSLVAILGASGSGKTTLLRLLAGFERADSGRIAVAGEPVCDTGLHVAPERRRIGYVAQEGALFPHLSVQDNVLFGLPRRDRRDAARAAGLLELVGLPASYATRGPHQLSGGEQQRVALARALAPGPRLVLLDEPFSALDAALRTETRRAVAAALSQAGATALLVTHDQSEALSMGEQVAVLRRGRLVQMASPETLYRRPVDAELARFVGEAVLLPGRAEGSAVSCCLGRLALAQPAGAQAGPQGEVDVLLRPEQLRLDGAGGVAAVVREVTFYGHDASVALRLDGGVAVSARVSGHGVPSVGESVRVSVAGAVTAFARTQAPPAKA